jgi:hypothetical protein
LKIRSQAGVIRAIRADWGQAVSIASEVTPECVGPSSSATVLKLRSEYSAQATDDGPCSTEHCAFSLEFAEWDSIRRLAQKRSWLERPTYYVVRALQPFGLRPNYLTARLRVDNGKLSSVDAWFTSRSFLEPGYLSDISLQSRSVGNFRHEVGWPEIYEHPKCFCRQAKHVHRMYVVCRCQYHMAGEPGRIQTCFWI